MLRTQMAEPKDPGETWEGVPTLRTSSERTTELTLQVVTDAFTSTHALPASGQVIIGRADRADIVIDDPSLSRRHAALHLGPPLAIEDLGSANGTRLRDQPLTPERPTPLSPGDAVELGDVLVIVQRRPHSGPTRTTWTHEAFEAALDETCRQAEPGAGFVVIRVRFDSAAQSPQVHAALAETFSKLDRVAAFAPNELEARLPGATRADAQRRLSALTAMLAVQGISLRAGAAHFPTDGRNAQALLGRADVESRPSRTGAAALVVESEALGAVMALAERVAPSELSVLILGETGVGKERIAELIHQRSPRSKGPLLRLSGAALSESLLESELFGHEKGAFTGAVAAKPGLLESAGSGTVFLDEIGELPPSTQAKLLRVLEAREVTRVGALKPTAIDVRFLSATHRNLEAEVAAGRFRQDLYFRINGMTLTVPPLRQRRADILPLARAFLPAALTLSAEAEQLLERYAWPGNVRELRNVVERAALLSDGKVVSADHLPVEKLTEAAPLAPAAARELSPELEAERRRLLDALAACGGNQTRAARALGISRGTLLIKMDAFQIQRPRKKLPFSQ
jgi:DNA-binding NtrC family response regulator